MSSGKESVWWQCRNPDCPPQTSIPLSVGATFNVCPFCSTPQSKYSASQPDDHAHDSSESDSKIQNKKELRPFCQNCGKRLLIPTARVCEYCKYVQRKNPEEASNASTVSSNTPQQESSQQPLDEQQLLKYKKPKEVGVLLSAQSNKESRDKKKVKTTTTVDLADKKKCDLPGDPSKLSGLITGQGKFIEVIFHVILPKPHWEWDKSSKIYLRFGCRELGKWEENVGDFKIRDFDETFCVMTCQLKLKPEIFVKAIPYKYVIFTPKTLAKKHSFYEVLHDIPGLGGKFLNRYLMINQQVLKSLNKGGIYKQYDTMVFPNDSPVVNKFMTYVGFKMKDSSGAKPELKVPANSDMRHQCLLIYLEKYKNLLFSGFSQEMTISQFVEDVQRIFAALIKIYVTYRIEPHSDETLHSLDCKRDIRPMKQLFVDKWLQPCVEHLPSLSTEKQLAHSACIAWCTFKLEIPSSLMAGVSAPIVGHLCALQPAADSQQWKEYNYLCRFLPNSKAHRYNLGRAIRHFVTDSIQEKQFPIGRLFGMPLVNFLNDTSQPYEDIFSKDYEQLIKMWSHLDKTFSLKVIRSIVSKTNARLVEQHYFDLKNLFDLDPLVLQAFIYICPVADLPQLFKEIPPHLSVTWLSYLITELTMDTSTLLSLMSTIDKNLTVDVFLRFHHKPLVMTVSALSFFTRCTVFLMSPHDHYLAVIHASLAFIFKTMALYVESKGEESINELNNVFTDIHINLQKWICDKDVVGGTLFGHPFQYGQLNIYLTKCDIEVKIWKSLLTVKSSNVKVTDRWQGIVREILLKRLKEIPENLTVSLLPFMENNSEEHEVLTNVVMDAALKVAENMLLKSYRSATDSYIKMTEANNNSKLLGNVLGTILKKKYPQLNEDDTVNDWITLDVLLEWDLWPNYVKIVKQDGKRLLSEGLQPECQIACICASTKFDDICVELQQGDVSLHDLQKMKEKEVQLRRLCEAVSGPEDTEKLSQKAVLECLYQRLEEFDRFSTRQQAYLDVCKWIPDPKCINGIDQLKIQLEQDYGSRKIKDLCSVKDGILKLSCLHDARPLDPFVDHFGIMQSKGSSLFLQPLRQNMKQVLMRTGLTIADIYSQIWKPTFVHCQKLVNGLASLKMTLSFVNLHLKPCKKNLETEVRILATGLKRCSTVVPDNGTIDLALSKVRDYWRICEYQGGAQVVLNLRKVLNLEGGDFSQIQKLAANLETSKKDKTLASIDSDLVKAGEFLREIIDKPERKHCLQTFVKCQDIIEWLRKSTQSINEIESFVTVASAGGEEDLATSKLSSLRNVGNGFSSLIYDVPKTTSYIELMQRCTLLWDSLEKTSKLPMFLEECNKDVLWYQSVKDTQGLVDTTSYGQMTNILKYGAYRVGFRKPNSQTVHHIITLTLSQSHKKLIKTKYNLDELRDLESELVLICGSKADTRADVDHYLNLLHSATRIAELYLDLQRAGDVTYSTAVLEFRCAVYDVHQEGVKDPQFNEVIAKKKVSDLQEYTRTLDTQLVQWKKSVNTAREMYYELNYFTTLQLLELRRELGQLAQQTSSAPPIKPGVLMLLKSVSPNVSSAVVFESLQATHQRLEDKTVDEDKKSVSDSESGEVTESKAIKTSILANPVPPSVAFPSAEPLLSTLTYEDLDERQQHVFTNLVNRLGYTESHVLRAFQEVSKTKGKEANLYDIEKWCVSHNEESAQEDNEETEEFSDGGSIFTTDYELSDSEELETTKTLTLLESIEDSTATQRDQLTSADSTPSIRTVMRESIDVNHPKVLELVKAGYDLQAAVEAIDQCRDVKRAMIYLDALEREETEGTTCEGAIERSISREEYVEDRRGLEQQSQKLTSEADSPVFTVESEVDLEEIVEQLDLEATKSYLGLDQLGQALQAINESLTGAVSQRRTFKSSLLKTGVPNLLVTSQDIVLRSVLALFTTDSHLPLPTQEEVLLCTDTTTTEEVTLLWRRAIKDPGFKRIFCLAHAEKLSYQVCDAALRSLAELSQGKKDYRLVIICSKEDEDKSHIISRLHTFRRPVVPSLDENECRKYLKAHFTLPTESHILQVLHTKHPAAVVDPDNSRVRVVSSTRSGMGKSLYIKRRANELIELSTKQDIHVTIPVHGPVVTSDTLLSYFDKFTKRDVCTIYHLDIAPRVLREVDCLLFSLLILNGLSDSRGRVWKCHPSQLYVIEVTISKKTAKGNGFQTLNLLSLLPTVKCINPVIVELPQQLDADMLGMDMEEFSGPTIQRVYQYLRRHASNMNLDRFSYMGSKEGTVEDFLSLAISKCGVTNPSWSEIHHFTKFLDIQLHSCENSVFCDKNLVGDVMPGLKGFVVKFMIRMSQDFSTPSLEGVLTDENQEYGGEDVGEDDQLGQYQIVRRQWEQSFPPYIFFNDDHVSMTFVGFRVTENGDLVNPENMIVIEPSIMKPQLYTGLKQNGVNFDEDYRGWSKETMITKMATVMGFQYLHDPDDSYVLTTDNLVKMLAIQIRFRCDIPVVIMGETGCGKTRLIRYMCDLARHGRNLKNMLIIKIHGEITDDDVIKFVEDAETAAQTNKATDPRMSTVVFFDEANTTESIGLIKEIMCDRRMNGRAVSRDLKFIATCNPYRKHSQEMIRKLETAGLSFYVRETETQQKLGKIPLRQLVYRVLDLPPSMAPLVYDFGQLNTGTEYDYTKQIVKDRVMRHPDLRRESPAIISAISAVLATSQQFMRDQKNECSFVSLRDLERAMIVLEYFYEKMDNVFAPLMDRRGREEYEKLYVVDTDDEDEDAQVGLPLPSPKHPNSLTRALLLSLSVCYHARLQDREPYEDLIAGSFRNPLSLPGGAQQFRDEIKWCQEGLLDNMVLRPNVAKNTALRENVFLMAICIELRIPLFLVGKPGTSKSLAKSVIQDSMHGKRSQSQVLKDFKEVHIFSYQCSQLSTPESVIEVFKSAERFQANQDIKQYVSVVVLDMVGLAEDSPSLPLKALHPLLEDGTEGSGKDHQQQTVEREKRVAFIGISNWALDPAKMNRGVMVTRGVPGLKELKLSALGICSTEGSDPVRDKLQPHFEPLSRAYMEICRKQERQFFGLRDYYRALSVNPSLIKMLYWMCNKSKDHPLSWPQLEYAIRRNFGGLESKDLNPLEEFKREIGPMRDTDEELDDDDELHTILNPDLSEWGLIKTSLRTKDTSWHGENRYLLFLTENYAALDILHHYINMDSDGAKNKPYILFGSSFPKEKEYTQVCRNINQIKICMETGRTVILLNLESLYESLYDVLNQYYMHYGDARYVDLGLQTHRVKCRVDDDFKLILIAEKDTVYKKFPTPLINRLEKHFVLTSSVLENWQHEVLRKFEKWIQDFSRTSVNKFREAHAFIGYQNDTPAAVIFQATKLLRRLMDRSGRWECHHLQKAGVLNVDLNDLEEKSPLWSQVVLRLSQFLLLQTASDDALIGLKKSSLSEEEMKVFLNLYYKYQHHFSIREFLEHECTHSKDREMFMQVTTHSPLMTQEELKAVAESLSMGFAHFDLHEFDTELDFSNKIGAKFLRGEGQAQPFLVVVQCDSGHLNCDLIAFARYRVCNEAIKAKSKNEIQGRNNVTHILFVIRLPQHEVKSKFVGFQGDPWISVHIDDLRPTFEATVLPEQALTMKISELFIGELDKPVGHNIEDMTPELLHAFKELPHNVLLPAEEDMQLVENTAASFSNDDDPQLASDKHFPSQHRRLLGCVQAAVSMLKDSDGKRSKYRIEKLMALIPKTPPDQLDNAPFYALLVKFIHQALKQREQARVDEKDWVLIEAMSGRKLQSGGTFRNVLARRIDEVITPYFAELIALFDRNCNLDLLDAKNQTAPISLFWLGMFHLVGGQINFISLTKWKSDIKTHFPCKLPFSWFLKEEVEAQRNVDKLGLQKSLDTIVEALDRTEIGSFLGKVSEENVADFSMRYLHDFVRYVYQSGNRGDLQEMELKLIMDELDSMTHHPDLCSVDGHESLSHRIVTLHLVYNQCSTEVLQFSQLVLQRPGILKSLSKVNFISATDWDFTLHLRAVQVVLESDQEEAPSHDIDLKSQILAGLNPPLHKEKQSEVTENIQHWLNHVRLSQNIIDTILRSGVKTEIAVKARLTWQRVRALQIFAEKVYIPHCEIEGIQFIIRRLELALKSDSDFLKYETLDGVKQVLNSMFSTKKLKLTPSIKAKIKRDCNRFFIEVISSLCFGGREAPEPDLVKMLLDTVLHDTETSKLSPYKDHDKIPTIRSFLLQLLLEKEHDQVEEYLRYYFDRSLRVSGGNSDYKLCLLCIQCFEDALWKKVSMDNLVLNAAKILKESYLYLVDHPQVNEPQVSLQYLQSIAGVRFGLSVAAEQLKNGDTNSRLLRITHDLCVDHRINVIDPLGRVDTTGPALYLLKILIRQFGYPCLKNVSATHFWIIPEELMQGEEEKTVDPFVLYGGDYINLKRAVSAVVYTKKTDDLSSCVKGGYEPSLLTFALYQKVTLSRASTAPTDQLQDEALHILNTFIQESTELSHDLMHLSRLLLSNQQGGTLAQLAVFLDQPPLCRTLSKIVIHSVSVILSRTGVDLLQPFLYMLNNPTALENSYLPTMSEDMLQEVKQAAAESAFYECPNGHPYLIGNCGNPVVEDYCPECNAKIGGEDYQLSMDNKRARAEDATRTGYDLGLPQHRSLNPERVRNLSAPAVCIVRALMHSAFIWASCHNQDELVELSKLIRYKDQVLPRDLPEFFWLHLEKDLECLCKSTGRGMDECAIIMHLVLKRILQNDPTDSAASVNDLDSKDARREWEQLFSNTYINPILINLDNAITEAVDKFIKDIKQEHDQLFYLAYEKVKVDESKLQAHLWIFRQQINLEHLQRAMQSASAKKKTPVLEAFLQAEPSLRATRYLPDIVKLQRFLFDMYDKRLEKGKALEQTVNDFLREVKKRFNENKKNECHERIKSLKRAWALVYHKLKNHRRLPVEEEYLLPDITDKTPLAYLVPTTMNEGRCTTALVDYLVITHNDFIENCRSAVNKGAESATAVWREHKIPITHLHPCHMLEYEHHLQSIILSHCHYSLTVGKGQKIDYDLPALEKHILDRFIYGKPVIQVDIPHVAYRKDIYTAETFLDIRRKVKPQVIIDQRVQQDIVTELKTPDKLRESLDVVDIVLGLLSSGRGSSKLPLKQFISSRKMSKKSFSAKAKEYCTLGHIISLWETISVELARQLWYNEQEPFEAISDDYTRELSDGQRNELDKCLGTFDLGLLLGVLFEFIEVDVKRITDKKQKDFKLVEALDVYWGRTEQTFTQEDTLRGFPSSLAVDQAVATWKYVADYKIKRH